MAKVGEGDPRWLVENRADGRNVNNWHWTEKNCLGWTQEKLPLILQKEFYQSEKINIRVKSVPTIKGECTANNRKGKTFFLFELDIKALWQAEVKLPPSSTSSSEIDEEEPVEKKVFIDGDFFIPTYDDETEPPRVKVSITGDGSGDKEVYNKVEAIVKKEGVEFVKKAIAEYLVQLREYFSVKVVHSPNSPTTASTTTSADLQQKMNTTSSAGSPTTKPSTGNTKTLTLKEEFKASPMDSYDYFVNPDKIKVFTQSDCVFENKEGGKFSLYGGFITGTNQKLVPGSQLVQKWRMGSWPTDVYSTVTINFTVEDTPSTKVEIVQSGIPYEEYDKTLEGWKVNILDRLIRVFGLGSRLVY
eukprot:gene2670-3313_t